MRHVIAKWKTHHPKGWWGDHLDVRFYLISRLKRLHGKKILDVACNAGVLLSEIPDDNLKFAFDLDSVALRIAKKLNPKAHLKKASMFKLPYPGKSFDVVVLANVLPGADFEVPKGQRAKLQKRLIAEVTRVLKKNGSLYLSTPNHAYYRGGLKERYWELEELLEGFEYNLQGWNPFLRFPFFLPARVLSWIPGWFSWLRLLSEGGFFKYSSKYFYTEAKPK